MKPEPKALIGQNINTEGFGVSVIRDVYFSTESETYVYEVSPTVTPSEHYLVFEEDVV